MPFALSFPLNIATDTSHWGKPKGTTGRDGETIVGICLHVLEATVPSYLDYLRSPRNLSDIRPLEHGSMNYLVSADGTLFRTVIDTNTAWAVPELNDPTWTLLNDHVGVDPDYLFIHVGVEKYISEHIPTLMFRGLADLVTFLCDLHDLPIDADHIIDHAQLDTGYADCADGLAANLIATVTSLAAAGNTDASVNIAVLAQQVAALQTEVDALDAAFTAALATISTYSTHVTTKAGSATLGHILSGPTLDVNASTGLATVKTLAASYKIVSGSQAVVASIAAIVQFPTVISDALSWATLGVSQRVTPTVAGLYRLRARIQFAASTWSAGKYIQLDVFKNGALLETIAYRVIEANLTTKIVEMEGDCSFLAATLTDYYDVRVITDDANGSKTIAAGSMSVEKVGA